MCLLIIKLAKYKNCPATIKKMQHVDGVFPFWESEEIRLDNSSTVTFPFVEIIGPIHYRACIKDKHLQRTFIRRLAINRVRLNPSLQLRIRGDGVVDQADWRADGLLQTKQTGGSDRNSALKSISILALHLNF